MAFSNFEIKATGLHFLSTYFVDNTPPVAERGKRDVYCDKQVEEVVTVLNCMLKGLWGKGGSIGIVRELLRGDHPSS